jgi:uncharacterized protein (TIGR03083 family)
MDRDTVWEYVDAQRRDLADLAATFTGAQWATRSLCTDWTVRDVVAHLTLTDVSPLAATRELLRRRGNLNAVIRETARDRARRLDDAELVAELRSMAGRRGHPIGTTHVDPLVDVLVHGQDIAVPLALNRAMPTEAAVVAAQRVATMGYWRRARRQLGAVRLEASDAEWAIGSGTVVRGPIAVLLLILAGRRVRLDELESTAVFGQREPRASS